MTHPALLALEDGSVFYGVSIGARGQSVGEVVFNTAITGYLEILTDPSYFQQIVTLTYPHIGNVGANAHDEESPRVYAGGLLLRDVPKRQSNWRSEGPLGDYLESQGVVAIAGIDTPASRAYPAGGWGATGLCDGGGGDRCGRGALRGARLRGSRRGRSRPGGHHSPSVCLGRGQPEARGSRGSFCTGGSRRVLQSI